MFTPSRRLKFKALPPSIRIITFIGSNLLEELIENTSNPLIHNESGTEISFFLKKNLVKNKFSRCVKSVWKCFLPLLERKTLIFEIVIVH